MLFYEENEGLDWLMMHLKVQFMSRTRFFKKIGGPPNEGLGCLVIIHLKVQTHDYMSLTKKILGFLSWYITSGNDVLAFRWSLVTKLIVTFFFFTLANIICS